jgi:hypothetical protein
MYTGKFFVNSLKKKKNLYEFFKNIDKHTFEEIDALNAQLWYRERFKELKEKGFVWSPANEKILIDGINVTEVVNADVTGILYEYRGVTTELQTSRGTSIIIEDGENFLVLDNNEAMIGSMRLTVNPSSCLKLMSLSKKLKEMLTMEYKTFYRERIKI